VVPYGVYDVGANCGYVSLGIDHDTAQFAVNAARLWLDRKPRLINCRESFLACLWPIQAA
jgi:Rhodopirellula transposase DDE domain